MLTVPAVCENGSTIAIVLFSDDTQWPEACQPEGVARSMNDGPRDSRRRRRMSGVLSNGVPDDHRNSTPVFSMNAKSKCVERKECDRTTKKGNHLSRCFSAHSGGSVSQRPFFRSEVESVADTSLIDRSIVGISQWCSRDV